LELATLLVLLVLVKISREAAMPCADTKLATKTQTYLFILCVTPLKARMTRSLNLKGILAAVKCVNPGKTQD
jgi:hypothetical protein